MSSLRRPHALALAAMIPLLGACTDRALTTLPSGLRPEPSAATTCQVIVADRSMTCVTEGGAARLLSPNGAQRDGRIIGGQEMYIKLAVTSNSYDNGTEVLTSGVTVQNLTRSVIGSDGSQTPGVMVFFHEAPTVTGGSGTVSLVNPDGTAQFTAAGQEYFLYPQALAPLEVSANKAWQFNVPATVVSFQFKVYVSALMSDEVSPVLANTWTGTSGTDWFDPANWSMGVLPDSTPASAASAAIPMLSMISSGNLPSLTGHAVASHVRVGSGSALALNNFTLSTNGNIDAVGPITGGLVIATGPAAIVGGTVNRLHVIGSARLQKAVVATGDVTIDGTLTVSDQTLTINIP